MGDDTFNRIRSIIAADLEIAPNKVMLPTSFIVGGCEFQAPQKCLRLIKV